MIRLTLLLCLAFLPSCSNRVALPADPLSAVPVAETPSHSPPPVLPPTRDRIAPLPPQPTTLLSTHRLRSHGLTITILTFDSRNHSLHVLDNEHGPGTGTKSSKSAANSMNGIAAINGGFFTPEGKPLGLVYEKGRKYGGLSTSSLGAGIYALGSKPRTPSIFPRSAWQQQRSSQPPVHLLQSGPFLLKNSKTVSGLSTTRPRERSFLLWNGNAGWAIGHSSSTSLASLSKSLATQPISGFRIDTALNLDGGSSSDLWVSSSVKGGPVSTRHLWNKNVRNYLVLVPNNQ